MPNTKKKPAPEFQSEDEEREFWAEPRFDGVHRLAVRRASHVSKPEAHAADYFFAAAGLHDRGSQSPGQQTGRTLSVSAEGVPRRTTGEGASARIARPYPWS